MGPRGMFIGAALILAAMLGSIVAPARAGDAGGSTQGATAGATQDDPYPPVFFYDLSGPRVGITTSPKGWTRSQFGWHQEHQVTPAGRGPAFLVQSVFVVGGFERREFVPNLTLVFGARMPGGLEFGLGPSATLGVGGVRTSVVFALGRSFRVGGIRVPVDLALAADRDGQALSLMTGWAVRDVGAPR